MRAGGRLEHTLFHPDHKNPILLPRDNVVTELIMREVHSTKVGHSGREHTLAALRETFWVPKGRKIIDRGVKRCVIYRKCNWKPTEQRQADLPPDRLRPRRPFLGTGTDYFGPFTVRPCESEKMGLPDNPCHTPRGAHFLRRRLIHQRLVRFASPRRIRPYNGTTMEQRDPRGQAKMEPK